MQLEDKRLLDKDWRIRHLYSIASKDGGQTVRFVPNAAQEEVNALLVPGARIIILKSRQLGITSDISIYWLDDTLFNKNLNALSVLQTRDHAVSAFDTKVHFAWNNFSEELKRELGWVVDTERANQLKFGFGEGTFSKYTVATSGRSGTFQRVHISEFGTLCADRPLDAKEVITGTFPAVPQDGIIVIESTANGELGYFAEMWLAAIQGKSNWTPLFLNWRYDKAEIEKAGDVAIERLPTAIQDVARKHNLTQKEANYYYEKFLLLNSDWQLMRQEYPTTWEEAFQGSGDRLFDQESIAEYEAQVEEGKQSGNTILYDKPKEGHHYVIGADPAEGVGRDSSAAVVWDISTPRPKVVLTFASDFATPEDFALILKELAVTYNRAIIAVERNNHGHAVLALLRDRYEEDLLYREERETYIKGGESTQLGFRTTATSKATILSGIAHAIRDKDIVVTSKPLITEMRICPTKELSRLKATDETTKHFDMLMAAAIGFHAQVFARKHTLDGKEAVYIPKKEFDPHAAL